MTLWYGYIFWQAVNPNICATWLNVMIWPWMVIQCRPKVIKNIRSTWDQEDNDLKKVSQLLVSILNDLVSPLSVFSYKIYFSDMMALSFAPYNWSIVYIGDGTGWGQWTLAYSNSKPENAFQLIQVQIPRTLGHIFKCSLHQD